MMDSEILKFICANQGAVNTDDLLFNLCSGDSTKLLRITSNRDKFASCCVSGQPKVVARTSLRLCRLRDCGGTCGGLHLCKSFFFSGSCRFSRMRGGCNFSHELNSYYNQEILREHDLESLDRTELCTLLLQSDYTLLPPICYDYNNGHGEFGRCQDGEGCKRLHICERSLKGDCSCPRTHDFDAPQPLKVLKEKDVPDNIMHSLKFIYSNKEAIRFSDNKGNGGNRGNRGNRGNMGIRGNRGHRGNRGNRGNRGIRGNRGNMGNPQPMQRTYSTSDILVDIDGLDLYTEDGQSEPNHLNPFTCHSSAADNDTEASSGDGQKGSQTWYKTSAAARGRGGHRDNRGNQQLKKTRSTNDLTSAVDDNGDGTNKGQRRRPVRDKTEICMYFIKGYCKHEDKCFKVHDKMPYRWEIKEGDQWTAMADNETIEKDYCDPKNTYSGTTPPVHFDTMTCGLNQVRRLSTINSLVEPNFIHTTEWVWYWEDEFGKWNMYAAADFGHKAADTDSAKLEQKFLDNSKDVVEFTAGSHSYSLSFEDMIQTNKHYGTKRVVKRRPRFVSAAEVITKRVRKPQTTLYAIPDHWDKGQIPATGYKRVSLQRTSDEFKEIEALFLKTMRGFDIVKIERIQNKALWEVFQWQKNQMKNNNYRCSSPEKKLFHGTDSKYIDAICLSNFDWRLCGVHGTAYGKGSYFARDAKYSHSYTDDSDVKSMFIARVLVGDFTKGSTDYRRPPSKDGGDVNFYDSCVDNVIDPSIFVVFEKHQIYPEYLLQYKTTGLYGTATVRAPKPAIAPKPSTLTQPTTSLPARTTSVQSRISSYQPSTSSYHHSTLAQSSTSTYQPSTLAQSVTSSYQPSTSSYQPSTSSYQPSTSSYRRSPLYSPPTPPPKKSPDSCVIA